jgi:EmrB/QacA subfamily drug resistance transporter
MSNGTQNLVLKGAAQNPVSPRNPWTALAVLCAGYGMILLDLTVVNNAMPSIMGGLHTGVNGILWVINAYVLVYAVLLITAGRVGDLVGQRAIFAGGLAIFTVASALCGFAQTTSQLVAARILQGVGGALLTPQTLALVTSIFPSDRRGTAMGVWGAVAGLATITGPTLGGFIVTRWDWRWVFFINVPIGVVVLLATFLLVPDIRFGRRQHLDVAGVALASVGLVLVVFGLIEGQRFHWGRLWGILTIPETIGAGLLVLTAFFFWERTQKEPLFPFVLFADRNFLWMNWMVSAMSFAMLGFSFLLPIYLQSALGRTAFQAGLTVAPMSLSLMVLAPIAGRWADRPQGQYLPPAGLLCFAGSMALIAWLGNTSASGLTLAGPMVLAGLGIACVMPPSTTLAMRSVPPRLAGAASGVLNTTRQLGGVLGTAAVGALLENRLALAGYEQSVASAVQMPPLLRQQFAEAFIPVMRLTLIVPITLLVVAVAWFLASLARADAAVPADAPSPEAVQV